MATIKLASSACFAATSISQEHNPVCRETDWARITYDEPGCAMSTCFETMNSSDSKFANQSVVGTWAALGANTAIYCRKAPFCRESQASMRSRFVDTKERQAVAMYLKRARWVQPQCAQVISCLKHPKIWVSSSHADPGTGTKPLLTGSSMCAVCSLLDAPEADLWTKVVSSCTIDLGRCEFFYHKSHRVSIQKRNGLLRGGWFQKINIRVLKELFLPEYVSPSMDIGMIHQTASDFSLPFDFPDINLIQSRSTFSCQPISICVLLHRTKICPKVPTQHRHES